MTMNILYLITDCDCNSTQKFQLNSIKIDGVVAGSSFAIIAQLVKPP